MLEKKEYLLLFILIIVVLLLTSGCGYHYPAVYNFGSIEITTNPSGAKIFFNGTDAGHITPYILTNVPIGSYIITLTLSGYLNSSNIVEVKANQISGINANLTPAPTLPTTSPTFLTSIEVQPKTMNLEVGESETISSVTAYYSDSSTANINLSDCNYSSSNPNYATVSNSGTITAVSDGSATITISYTEGGATKTTSVEITAGTVTLNEVVYRALCIGIGDYIQGSDNDLSAPPYDVDIIRQILQQCRFGSVNTTFSNIVYLKDWQATKSNIIQSIYSTFSGADSNDISYFYFSGHGSRLGNTSYICPADITSFTDSAISVDELEAALGAIPGTKVVFLDSCYSGGFIGKSMDETIISKEKIESFNDEVINVFSQAQPKGLLVTNQYKVLTSCHYYQLCWEIQPEEGDPFGVFTMALCEGCGYSGDYPADTNMDTKVSLQEAYLYVRNWVFSYRITQNVQIYPDNSTFTIVEY